MTKITGLTRFNISAIREVFADSVEAGSIQLTATTATFDATPDQALVWVQGRLDTLRGGNNHPRGSLYAVVRKIARQIDVADVVADLTR